MGIKNKWINLAGIFTGGLGGLVTPSLWRKAEGLVALYEFKAEKAGEQRTEIHHPDAQPHPPAGVSFVGKGLSGTAAPASDQGRWRGNQRDRSGPF